MGNIGIYKVIRDQLHRAKVPEAEIDKFLARPEVARGIASAEKLSNSESKFTVSVDEKYKTIQLHITLERPYTFCHIKTKDGFETRHCSQEHQLVIDDSYVLDLNTPTTPSAKPHAITRSPIARKPMRHVAGATAPSPTPILLPKEMSASEQSLAILFEQSQSLETQLNSDWKSAEPMMESARLMRKEPEGKECHGNCKSDPYCLTPDGGLDWGKVRNGSCFIVQCGGS